MKWIVSLSGGTASAISAIACHENHIPYELVFADTLIEDDDLYRFIRELSKRLNKPIHWLKDGRTPWDVFFDEKMVGGSRIASCSRILKTELIRKWIDANCEPNDPLVLGMDWAEQDRIDRAQKNWTRPVVSLLNDLKIRRPAFAGMLAKYDITPPKLYDFGFPHNNCGGFCVRAGLKQFATLLERFPDRYAFHEAEQERVSKVCTPKTRNFLRKTIKGTTYFLSMKEFRLLYQTGQIEVEPYDFGGCGCFVDASELPGVSA